MPTMCTSLRALFLILFALQTFQHECIHDTLESEILVNDPSNSLYATPEGRVLQAYKNIQIIFDPSNLTGVTDAFRQYILDSLLPPVQNIIQAALKVRPRSANLKTKNINTLCSGTVTVPSVYNKVGVEADLVIFLKAQFDPDAIYVASATACLLDSTTQRPVMGKITYNLAKVTPTTNEATREKDILVTLHEITHVLGFSGSLYKYYINPQTGKELKDHYYTKKILGMTSTILNLSPLTTRLRNHFNCPTLEGAYLENQGGSGSAGSHFERRILYNEYMTASAIIDTRLTEFSLALLEGTGWYQPNYDMADPITWGKNQGCSFVQGACMDRTTLKPNFKEFCSSMLAKSCSWTRRAGGACGAYQRTTDTTLPSAMNWWGDYTASQDTFSDNCPIVLSYGNVDCEDSSSQAGAILNSESYGYGSKCFMGTLYPNGGLGSAYPFCFKSSCKKTNAGKYYVEVKLGAQTANCYREGPVSVSGYGGALNCPDPDEFCGQVMTEGFCRRGCSGRGTCVNQECVCEDGWSGFDCSQPNYEDGCSRCANNDPLQTTCYKDSCACNPTNSTCMCPPGTLNESECIQAVIEYTGSLIPDSNSQTNTGISKYSKDKGISTGTLIAIICGAVGGVLVILGTFFGVRYARKVKKIRNTTKEIRPRPPVLQLHLPNITEEASQSNQDSAEFTRKAMSVRSHNNSPLIRQESPTRGKIHGPSLFKNYSPQVQSVEREKEFELHITPLDLIHKFNEVEDPKVEHVTEPDAKSPESKQEVPFEIKAQNYIVPDV